MVNVKDIDRAWLAGFFDGDGYLRLDPPEIYINQKDPTILSEIRKLTGIGRVTSFTGYQGNTYYRIILKSRSDIKRFLEVIHPYLRGPKASKVDALYSALGYTWIDNESRRSN